MKISKKNIIKIVLGIIFISVIAIVGRKYLDVNDLIKQIEIIRNNPFAPIIYVLIYVVGVIFALPGLALTITAAPIFGFWNGLLLVVIGANIGCQVTFWISRVFGKDFVNKFIKADSFLDKASNKIEKNGFIFMLSIRLIPIFPFNGINYLSGLTKVKYKDYTLGTLLGMLPVTAVYVYLSYTASDIRNNPLGIIISVSVLVLFTIVMSIIKKKKHKEIGSENVLENK